MEHTFVAIFWQPNSLPLHGLCHPPISLRCLLLTIGLMSGTVFLPAVMAYGVCTEKLATSIGECSPSVTSGGGADEEVDKSQSVAYPNGLTAASPGTKKHLRSTTSRTRWQL